MHRRTRVFGILAVLAVILSACDWPMTRFGPEGTAANPEITISAANVNQLTPLFLVSAQGRSVVESSHRVVAGNQIFDASTGALQWTGNPGEFFTVIGSGLVYGTTTDPVTHSNVVLARDLFNGGLKWAAGFPDGSVSLFANGSVIGDFCGCHGGGDNIEGIDGQTGAVRWVAGFGPESYSGPTVSNGIAYFVAAKYESTDTHTYLWALDTNTDKFVWNVVADPCGTTFSYTAPVVANGHVYANGHTFDARTGKLLFDWAFCPPGMGTTSGHLSITSDRIFVPYIGPQSQPRLAALDASTGALKWSIPWNGDAPAVVDGVLFGTEPTSGPGFDSATNHIFADDAASGARLWNSPVDPHTSYGEPIVANGVLYGASTTHLDAWHLPGH